MSVKNHDGLRATVADPFEAGLALRAVLEPAFYESFRELVELAHAAVEANPQVTWDELFFVPGKLGKAKVRPGYRLVHDLYQVVTSLHGEREYTFSKANIGYDVSLLANAAGGNPLILVFGEQARGYRELLVSQGAVEAYGYWDNSDPEEGVSEAAWEERKRAWATLATAAPGEVGLEFSFPSSLATQMALSQKLTTE